MSLLTRTPRKTAAEEVADAEALINVHLAKQSDLTKQLAELERTYTQAVNDGDLETGAAAGQRAAVLRDMLKVLAGTIDKAQQAAQPAYARLSMEKAIPAHTDLVNRASQAAKDALAMVEQLRATAQASARCAHDTVQALETAQALSLAVEESAGSMNRQHGITVGTVARFGAREVVEDLHRDDIAVKHALEAAKFLHHLNITLAELPTV